MRLLSGTLALLCIALPALAQNTPTSDSVKMEVHADEVLVIGVKDARTSSTALNVEPYTLRQLDERTPVNLSDALSRIPGISQLSTGSAISKPVIRGLFGNRVLVTLSGLRFDNQQWQEEHGLGLSQIGIDQVEVVKGPASLLYGTDALGGVINIVEQQPRLGSGKQLDATVRTYSNTLGTLTDVGYSYGGERMWWRVRGGVESHADYSDGGGTRVLNSRNSGYYLKTGLGFRNGDWQQANTYNFSYNRFGFILEDLKDFFDPDARWSREMAGPHHIVMLNVLNSQNTFTFAQSILNINAGFQSNLRMEDEGSGRISLNMHLLSLLENARWETNLDSNLLLYINHQFTYENNKNYGGRVIVPDATLLEANLSGLLRWYLGSLIVEGGVGGTYKYIHTYETRTLNSPDKEIQPFAVDHPTFNAMIGASVLPEPWLNLKCNVSTGFRSANLAELSSNGLHEGVYRYEVGDPGMKFERNICGDFTAELSREDLFVSASLFFNRFLDYIYLAPTSEEFFGFPVFRYRQQNAVMYGGEATATARLGFLGGIQWKESFSAVRGNLEDKSSLPFVPAFRLVSALRYEQTRLMEGFDAFSVEPEIEYVFAQEHPAQFETTTPAYMLLNVDAGLTTPVGSTRLQWTLSCKNILNKLYADHLSRLKNYGLYNPGINISIAVKATFAL